MPTMGRPDNWCVFNGRESKPWKVARSEAAATLRRARHFRRHRQAVIEVIAPGLYRLRAMDTVILDTRQR